MTDVSLHYYRSKEGEVDMVCIQHDGELGWAIEAKWSDSCVRNPSEIRTLVAFCAQNDLHEATVTTRTKRGQIDVDDIAIEFVPTSLYCYTVGRNRVEGSSVV